MKTKIIDIRRSALDRQELVLHEKRITALNEVTTLMKSFTTVFDFFKHPDVIQNVKNEISFLEGEVIRLKAPKGEPLPEGLSPAKRKIIQYMANHDTTINEADNALCISPVTANQQIAEARKTVGVKTNIQLILTCLENGWIERD